MSTGSVGNVSQQAVDEVEALGTKAESVTAMLSFALVTSIVDTFPVSTTKAAVSLVSA